MMLLTKANKKQLPPLYSTESVAMDDKKLIIKFFDPTGSWTWYACEGDPKENGDYLFFGLIIGMETEWGYFTLSELRKAKNGIRGIRGLPIERDTSFVPLTVKELKRNGDYI